MKYLNLYSALIAAALAWSASFAAEKIPLSNAMSVGGNVSVMGQGSNTYEASNVLDGKLSSAWAVPYEDGKCILQLNPANAGAEVTEILINNGYGKDKKSFVNNSRAKEISIYVNGRNAENLVHKATLKDQLEQQAVVLPPTKNVDALFIKIESVYKGKKWNDLCISEIALQGVNHKVAAPAAGEALTDSRDGKSYKTVKIGTQVWMAENLNYAHGTSWCYDDNGDNCKKLGRLYNWKTAGKVCPAGWRLPSKSDFENLVNLAGGEQVGGRKLKSTSGWANNLNGTDALGFNAIAAGDRATDENRDGFDWLGYATSFWSSTAAFEQDGFALFLTGGNDQAQLVTEKVETTGYSVRCIKD